MVRKRAPFDLEIGRVAAEQHGVVTSKQLAAAGLSSAAVSKRVRTGRLFRVHRGIYSVGHPCLNRESHWMAAVLACGDGAVLSHGAAAALWGLLRPIRGLIDVSTPSRGGRCRRAGIRLHRCGSLAAADGTLFPTDGLEKRPGPLVTVRNLIPVTTVPRTIDDLRWTVPPYLVRRATRQAELAGYRIEGAETKGTRSDLESDFLELLSPPWHPSTRGQRQGRALRGRLPLARPTGRGRNGRLPLPPRQRRLRGRPRTRAGAAGR